MQSAALPARTRPFPLPADVGVEQSRSVVRACTAAILHYIRGPHQSAGPEAILDATWPGDRTARAIVTRAATAPASTTQSGWAAELAINATGSFLASLSIASAAAQLFTNAVRLSLDGVATIRLPYVAPTAGIAPPFIGEGLPGPVRQASLGSAITLGPARKMLVLTALTNELNDHSVPNAEAVMRQVLTESAARQVDAAVFSTTAGDAVTHPGLLYGVTPIAATTGGGLAAVVGDIENLVAAIAAAGGGRRVMLFVTPGKAVSLPVLAPGIQVEIVPTPALAATPDTVVAVDPSGIFSAYDGSPTIDVSQEATLHFEDSSPLQLTTGPAGSAVIASPARNLFQVDSFSLRLRLPVAFVSRPGFTQVVNSVTW